MISVYELVRARLLALGPAHPILRGAVRLQASMLGLQVSTKGGLLVLTKGRRRMVLSADHTGLVPAAAHLWDILFRTVTATQQSDFEVLDFSAPRIHHYRNLNADLWAPGMAEEDSVHAYTLHFQPQRGDVVWDVGAHAGATTLLFSRMVGPEGRVFAFEPDKTGYEFLLRNIEMQRLSNVVPVRAALARDSGMMPFTMDGTQGAGLVGFSQYADGRRAAEVECYALADACERFGVPRFVKMDIEGAEAAVIEGAAEFLRGKSIHFAIETEHRVDRVFTSVPLTRTFTAIGYEVITDKIDGQRFTSAAPCA